MSTIKKFIVEVRFNLEVEADSDEEAEWLVRNEYQIVSNDTFSFQAETLDVDVVSFDT